MIIRLAIAALVLWVVYLVWRNLGARARFELAPGVSAHQR